jgi:opacity protein-like surface antigen
MRNILCILLVLTSLQVSAQSVSVKTNLIYDVSTTVNLGAEFGLSPKWTLDVSANYNGWTFSENKKWKHWLIQPEVRYWLCERFNGHFVGAHLLGGIYNIGNLDTDFMLLGTDFGQLKNYRYEGWMAGVGVGYGYQWLLSRHWSLEAEIGVGYVYSRADKFECATCGEKLEDNEPHHYVGPTKVALSLIYAF